MKSGLIKENDLKRTSFVNKSDDDLDNWDGDDYELSGGEDDDEEDDDEDNSSEEFMYVSKDQIETYNKAKSEWAEEKIAEQGWLFSVSMEIFYESFRNFSSNL